MPEDEDRLLDRDQRFTIHIAQDWKLRDFILLMRFVEYLYNFELLTEEFGYARFGPIHALARRADHPPDAVEADWFMYRDYIRNSLNRLADEDYAASLVVYPYRLKVARIEYASPGFVDLVGFGKAVAQVRKMLKDLIFLREDLQDRRLKREIDRERLLGKRLENIDKALKLAKRMNIPLEDVRPLFDRVAGTNDDIARLMHSRKITRVE